MQTSSKLPLLLTPLTYIRVGYNAKGRFLSCPRGAPQMGHRGVAVLDKGLPLPADCALHWPIFGGSETGAIHETAHRRWETGVYTGRRFAAARRFPWTMGLGGADIAAPGDWH